jgi:hypothetical protein
MQNATGTQGLQFGRGVAVHIRDSRYEHLAPLCGGTRINGPAQAKRLVSAAPTCKACLKAAAK